MAVEKSTVERIKLTSKVLSVILKVARVCCFVGIAIIVVGLIYIMIFGNLDLLVLKGKVILHSPFPNLNMMGVDNWRIITVLSAGIAALVIMSILFKEARSIFADISIDDSPFELKQVKRIRKISILYFIITLMDFGTKEVSFSFTVNVVGIVGALMFWCIALIFEYGCELQKESDETL